MSPFEKYRYNQNEAKQNKTLCIVRGKNVHALYNEVRYF